MKAVKQTRFFYLKCMGLVRIQLRLPVSEAEQEITPSFSTGRHLPSSAVMVSNPNHPLYSYINLCIIRAVFIVLH